MQLDEIDYPAAHSMDTLWFAVDAVGHVGVFFTGEDGPAPAGEEGQDLFDFMEQVPGVPELDREEDDWGALLESVHQYGLFRYEPNEESWWLPLQPEYHRAELPARPLHVDQLPPKARDLVKDYALDELRFSEAETIQILHYLDCQVAASWDDLPCGYLDADGKTIRPVRGCEGSFEEYCTLLRKDFPKETRELRFEGGE
jgi:hypothetical protein